MRFDLSAEELAFISSQRSTILNVEVQTEREPEVVVPVPAPEVPARVALVAELADCPASTQMLRTAALAGWEAYITYARGPWVLGNGKVKLILPGVITSDNDEEEDGDEAAADPAKVPAIYESLALRARRGGQRVAATWTRRPWTKLGAVGKYQFAGAHIWPSHNGGGLHKSAVLRAVLKSEETDQ